MFTRLTFACLLTLCLAACAPQVQAPTLLSSSMPTHARIFDPSALLEAGPYPVRNLGLDAAGAAYRLPDDVREELYVSAKIVL